MAFNEHDHPRGDGGRFTPAPHREPDLALGARSARVLDAYGKWIDLIPGQRDEAAR